MHKTRIGILDGFRAIAITGVLLFHFFSRDDFPYPYQNKFDYFSQGKFGVQFFFIISGFVIFYTLENTSSLLGFYKKRLIRLYPSAIIASTLTLVTLLILTNAKPVDTLIQYLTSLSLIGPNLLNFFFSPDEKIFNYIDGALWSIWPEIQFYIIAGALFFFSRANFIRNFILLSLFAVGLFWLNSNINGANFFKLNPNNFLFSNLNSFIGIFNLLNFIQYFTIGAIFYELFKLKNKGLKAPLFLILSILIFVLIQIYFSIYINARITNVCMIILFVCFVYFPASLKMIDNRLFNKIGVSSYFLYLIHQNVGVILIERFGNYFFANTCFFTVLLIIIFIIISIVYTNWVEIPVIKRLKKSIN
ncbi:acyltransferase family protein [Mucilaginibacter sp.]|jgi:peptidoglycan/LPS O-acetylase OafA/YrhL|uniref:acyltransferase family protein n=1 Tax=Mucilaginibacter sp. TaxID=1882438 RepID=UPI0035667140